MSIKTIVKGKFTITQYLSWFSVLLFFCISLISNSPGQDIKDSVVQIEWRGQKRGIGVVVKEPDHIVTALHVVAGIDPHEFSVYSEPNGAFSTAYIYKVHKASDLALLKLDKTLGLPALQYTDTQPDASKQYFIGGYDGKPKAVRLRMTLADAFHQLSDIIVPTSVQYKWLLNNGYPSPNAQIIRLTDPIQHGDSGSPITDENNGIIGIADGGLEQGTRRMNWGISAAKYFDELWSSTEPVKNTPSKLPFLKNARSENELFSNEGDLEIYKIFTKTLGEINETALPEDQRIVNLYRKDGFEASKKDIFKQPVDVYEDYNSGATFAIPQGLKFFYDGEDGWLEAWTHCENVEMIILIKTAYSWDDAVDRVLEYQDVLFNNEGWEKDPQDKNPIIDYENRFYRKSLAAVRYAYDENEKRQYYNNGKPVVLSDLFAEIMIDNNFVMATAVKVRDIPGANEHVDDWYYCYAMEAAIVLSGFAIR